MRKAIALVFLCTVVTMCSAFGVSGPVAPRPRELSGAAAGNSVPCEAKGLRVWLASTSMENAHRDDRTVFKLMPRRGIPVVPARTPGFVEVWVIRLVIRKMFEWLHKL